MGRIRQAVRSRGHGVIPTRRRGLLSWLLAAMFAVAAAAGMVAVTAIPASAEGVCPPGQILKQVQVDDNPVRYEFTCVDPGGGGDGGGDGDGGGGGNECDLVAPFTYCNGGDRCYQSEWHPPWALPPEPKPSPEAEAVIENCATPPGLAPTSYPIWSEPGEPAVPPLADQAWSAFGELVAPDFTLEFSPADLSFVGTETFFWAEGPSDGELTGTSAFTVVAIATPDHIDVKPGDGPGVINCGWATSKSADCVKTYFEASGGSGTTDSSGRPAHPAQARLVYDVRFENAGAPLDLPGLPTTLESAWQTTPVPVGEVQVIVE